MADTMGGGAMFLDPEVEAMVLAFFCLVSLLLVSILIWIIFLCLKVDSVIHWSWKIVFIPLWIVDAVILWTTFYRMKNYDPVKNEEMMRQQGNSTEEEEDHEEEEEEENEEDELLGNGRKKKKPTKLQHLFDRFIPFVQCCLFISFQVLIVLHLDHHMKSTVNIFLPFYAYELINTLKNGKKSWLTRFVLVLQMSMILFQLLFIANHFSWFYIFIPTYCLGVFYALKLYRQYKVFAAYPQRQEAHQGQMLIMIASVIYAVFASLFYTVLLLLVRRLDGTSHIGMGLILIPVFIILVSFTLMIDSNLVTKIFFTIERCIMLYRVLFPLYVDGFFFTYR